MICYISVGSHENWRTDADQFPEEVLGKKYEGWSGERWLDIRRIDLLAPIMLARLDDCAAKGFDAVEPDNMQIWDNDTGFPLTYDDQLRYALWLADEAHKRGLAIGQKNAPDQTKGFGESITILPSLKTPSITVGLRICLPTSRLANLSLQRNILT